MIMSKNNKVNSKSRTSIGGQAVMEGVMMRGKSSMATAVRDSDGIIRVESKRIKPASKRKLFFRLPFVRGVVSFIDSLYSGTKILMRSAEVFGEGEPSKFEKWLAEKLKLNIMSVVSTISIIIALALAIFLFMWLPQTVRSGIESLCGESFAFDIWAKNFIEGGLKLLIFLLYLLLVSLLKDIKRTFMYHGAEHKTISCFENGLDLTVENAKTCTRIHDRCGTTFMVFVLVISILTFAVVESLAGASIEKGLRILIKIAMLPVVSGISYELLKLLAKTKSVFVLPLKIPGMLLQKITTREPSDDMLEVAITAFNTVAQMDNDPTIEEKEFVLPTKRNDLVKKVADKLRQNGIEEIAEAEWIVSILLSIKRSEIYSNDLVMPKQIDFINKVVEERCSGRPLWYCIGNTDFYGYTINVDERVLIPRPETELLVEQALKFANKDSAVLDMCTGSGAIAISINKESGATVLAVDISEKALELAKENAKLNSVEIEFIQSDMFSALDNGQKFDVIISNPPYIKTQDMQSLQKEVKDFEPSIALDGGVDGLDFYRTIAENAKKFLNSNGVVLLECGIGQANDISKMFDGYSKVEIIKDFENIDRIIKAVL